MGPRHVTSGLRSVLAEPLLSTVAREADDAARSGWFWNIRPLKAKASPACGSGGRGGRGGGAWDIRPLEAQARFPGR
jgi:hypothetical protein